ncbi:transcriptional regulator, partial [Streptococcus pneumoniae]
MYIRVKNIREDSDYNQSLIAQYLNCSQSTYS